MPGQTQTSTGLSVHVYGELHKVLTLPATVLLTKPNSVSLGVFKTTICDFSSYIIN